MPACSHVERRDTHTHIHTHRRRRRGPTRRRLTDAETGGYCRTEVGRLKQTENVGHRRADGRKQTDGGQTDRRTGGQADRRTGGQADRRTGGQADGMDGRRDTGRRDGTDGPTGWMDGLENSTSRRWAIKTSSLLRFVGQVRRPDGQCPIRTAHKHALAETVLRQCFRQKEKKTNWKTNGRHITSRTGKRAGYKKPSRGL